MNPTFMWTMAEKIESSFSPKYKILVALKACRARCKSS